MKFITFLLFFLSFNYTFARNVGIFDVNGNELVEGRICEIKQISGSYELTAEISDLGTYSAVELIVRDLRIDGIYASIMATRYLVFEGRSILETKKDENFLESAEVLMSTYQILNKNYKPNVFKNNLSTKKCSYIGESLG